MANSKLKCRGCKDRFKRDDMLELPGGNFCTYECATEYGKANGDKARKKAIEKQRKDAKKAKREFYRQELSWQHKQTQPVFNKMRVLQELKWFRDRELEPTCISCQKPLGGDQWCCGHFKTVGSNGRLRYDEKNTYLQHNRNCNMGRSGDINGYKIGLVARFGETEGAAIIDYCETNNAPIKRTWQELEAMRAEFSKTVRELEALHDRNVT